MNPQQVVFSLGSNQGNRLGYLRAGLDALRKTPGLRVDKVSSVYRTDPVGGVVQDDFFNVIALGRSTVSAVALLRRSLEIEDALGRIRTIRWGPRVIDIDLIAVGDISVISSELTLPHPRAASRAFVIVPWLELDENATLVGVPIRELTLETSGVHRLIDRL